MKRFFMSTAAAGLTLAMTGAPLALAQSMQGPEMAPHSNEVHATGPQHVVHKTTIVHTTVRTTKSNNTMPHQMTQVSHEEQRPEPPHAAFSGHYWHHGDHYTGGRNYVTNYQIYHLNAPPSGYRWVQDGSQFVLIGLASGIIADVIVNAAYQ
jgi:Ni/Co efflux regulator RcnB